MLVELNASQRDRLLQMVDAAIEELGPEIHHTFSRGYRAELREQRRDLATLRALLMGQPPLQAEATAESAMTSLFGSP